MDPRFSRMFSDTPDPNFNREHSDPENEIFKVVFYPDRIYHAAYFNATRSARYRYNVREVRNAFDITVLKAEVYMDGVFLSNVLRVEYRGARLTEVAREKDRFLRERILMNIRLLDPSVPSNQQPEVGPSATLYMHYDKWIDTYQTEIWESVGAPPRKHHDFRVLDQIGRMGPITSVFEFKELIGKLEKLRRIELSFRENDINLPFGYRIDDPQWDNNYNRNHQVPNKLAPSSPENTVMDSSYLVDFQRGYFFENVDTLEPVRYKNGMMEPTNTETSDKNIIEMRWVLQREFASSVVFFHKVTIPPGAIEGTHRHIGTEELYCIVEGKGIAYMGDNDDPNLDPKWKRVNREIYGLGTSACREVSVQPGSVIYTKSGGIHGIRNPNSEPLRFVAFLYHTS